MSDLHDFRSAADGYALNAVASTVVYRLHVLGSIVARLGWWAPLGLAVLLWLIALAAAWFGTSQVRLAIGGLFVGSVGSWALSYFMNNHSAFRYSAFPVDARGDVTLLRWGIGAALLVAAIVPLTTDVLWNRHAKTWLAPATMYVFMLIMVGWSWSGPTNLSAPNWDVSLHAAKSQCTSQPSTTVRIQTGPANFNDPRAPWVVAVPCARLNS